MEKLCRYIVGKMANKKQNDLFLHEDFFAQKSAEHIYGEELPKTKNCIYSCIIINVFILLYIRAESIANIEHRFVEKYKCEPFILANIFFCVIIEILILNSFQMQNKGLLRTRR